MIGEGEPARSGWVVPAVIAVAAVLILGGTGVIIGLLAFGDDPQQKAGPTPTAPTPTTEPTEPTTRDTTPAPPPGPTTPSVGTMPPIVTGPDQSGLHQSCDQGFALTSATGFGTHSGRGSPATSCVLANSVLTSYWAEYGNASPLPRAVSAPGAVDCSTVPGGLCDGANFLMHCQQLAGDGWITCTGGNNARVYLW